MAFNPVKHVGRKIYPTKFQAELAQHLRLLAELPPAPDTPYLTISLDWRPEGADPEYRSGLQRFEHDAAALQQAHWPRGEVYDSLGEDIEKARTFLTNELDPSAQGVYIVANAGMGVFEAMPLGMPLPTIVKAGYIPALLPLARLKEDNPTYAVLLADQQRATISLIAKSHRVEQLVLRSSDYPRKQHSGGWSQRRFQQRADERLSALARQIVSETEAYLVDHGIDALVVAGDEILTGALERAMPDQLREVVIATIRLDNESSEVEILEATMPIAIQAEAERERNAVAQARELQAQSDRAVAGSEAVLDALTRGNALKLIMNDDLHEDAWADYADMRYGVGERRDVLTDQPFVAVPIDVEQELVRLAILVNAEIDIIHSSVPVEPGDQSPIPDPGAIPRSVASKELDQLGGVAAILRYSA